jgi:hypothetical protein
MNREYASLLAQVVPVIAIAVGLEIRAITARIRSAGGEAAVSDWVHTLLLYLCMTLLVLGVVEIRALAVVGGGFSPNRGLGCSLWRSSWLFWRQHSTLLARGH